MKVLFGTLCILFAATGAAQAGTIVSPVAATATSTFSADFDIGNTIDQSGLDINFTSGVTDFDRYIGLNPLHTLLAAGNEWFTVRGVDSATLTFDLGATMTIGRIALWNEEFSGFSTGRVSVSTDGVGYSFLGTINPTDSPADLDYGAQVFSLGAAVGRFVELAISGCPQLDGAPDILCGMGEIAFESLPATVVPVPAAMPMTLGGLGVLGLVARRRRAVTA